ncbi:MAG: Holliday junction branch migration protein RuvA [Hornefia sp.]|nr:Holliday junction branch migration protein RuvA [Hornefia sp.]
MIRFLRGKFHPMGDGTVVIESGSGVGFLVYIPANSQLYKNLEGEDVKVYTHMIVREDDMSLYGFENKDELELFKLLITVNGVGAKAAMAIMSILPQSELRKAIATGDAKSISAANGVGKKTSERIILELKDKVGEFTAGEENFAPSDVAISGSLRGEAVTALVSLGYSRSEAETSISKIKEDNLTVEEYIMFALRKM